MKVLSKLGAAVMALVKNTGCSSRGPGFGSQLSHGSSQLPVDPVPGHPITSFGLHRYCMHMVNIAYMQQNIHTNKNKL